MSQNPYEDTGDLSGAQMCLPFLAEPLDQKVGSGLTSHSWSMGSSVPCLLFHCC